MTEPAFDHKIAEGSGVDDESNCQDNADLRRMDSVLTSWIPSSRSAAEHAFEYEHEHEHEYEHRKAEYECVDKLYTPAFRPRRYNLVPVASQSCTMPQSPGTG
jgi:hypothetical protein